MPEQHPDICLPSADDLDPGSAGTVAGYAAVFYRADDPRTQFTDDHGRRSGFGPTAFDQAIDQPEVLGRVEHAPGRPIGRKSLGGVGLTVDEVGLKFSIDIPDTPVGRAAVAAVRDGRLAGASLAFLPLAWDDATDAGGPLRLITRVKVIDVGPVADARCVACRCWARPAGLSAEAARDHDELAALLSRAAV